MAGIAAPADLPGMAAAPFPIVVPVIKGLRGILVDLTQSVIPSVRMSPVLLQRWFVGIRLVVSRVTHGTETEKIAGGHRCQSRRAQG